MATRKTKTRKSTSIARTEGPTLAKAEATRAPTIDRVSLAGGQWFDRGKAEHFEESTRWNGNNHISEATGSQWEHEALFRTASGNFVLYAWSQWQGSVPSFALVSDSDACRWLVAQGHHERAAELFAETYTQAEI